MCRETDFTADNLIYVSFGPVHVLKERVHVERCSRSNGRDGPGKTETVTGADQGRDPFLALAGIGRRIRKWPQSPPLGKAQCSGHGLLVRVRIGSGSILLLHPVEAELLREALLAVAARA
jgi:hypothetical protein